MENDILARDWKHIRDRVRQRWPELIEEDLNAINGSRAILMALLQENYGYTSDRADNEIEDLLNRLESDQTKEKENRNALG